MPDISSAAQDVLRQARVEGQTLYLPPGQLERSLYEEVNEVLTRLGGKWKGGKVKGHVFDSDPSSDLEIVTSLGEMPPKNPYAFFSTPPAVIQTMLHYLSVNLELRPHLHFLEPSAGKGAIVLALGDWLEQHRRLADSVIHVCEVQTTYARLLETKGFTVVADDFLLFNPTWKYDVILMNPPFSVEGDKQAYITHILHAWEMLASGGILVSIAPPGFTSEGRREKKLRDFLTLVEDEGRWDDLPAESFRESGTGIRTVILMLRKSSLPDIQTVQDVVLTLKREEVKYLPVFGDPRWIEQARQKKVASKK